MDTLIQVDFDDGHCPTVKNQVSGWINVTRIVQTKDLSKCPLMMLRPRAFNMEDLMVNIDSQAYNGALLDFAILAFHNAKTMIEKSPTYNNRDLF
jgi:malate synthase